ncbi:hypothetical protein [Crocosphaera chwakensis]|nr:hypothetical protein [Crocosphaera chwakensis]
MLKLRDFWIVIAIMCFSMGLYDFVQVKSANQSGDLLQETRSRANAYTEIGFGVGSIIIYQLARINAKLKEFNETLKTTNRGSQGSLTTLSKSVKKIKPLESHKN